MQTPMLEGHRYFRKYRNRMKKYKTPYWVNENEGLTYFYTNYSCWTKTRRDVTVALTVENIISDEPNWRSAANLAD